MIADVTGLTIDLAQGAEAGAALGAARLGMLAAGAGERRGGLRASADPARASRPMPTRAALHAPRLKRYRALYPAEKAARRPQATRHFVDQVADRGDQDLHADAHQEEGGEPHDHRRAVAPDEVGQPVGEPIGDPDDRGVGDRGEARAEEEGDEADAPFDGRSAPIVIATAIVPGPVVNGSVRGKNASLHRVACVLPAALLPLVVLPVRVLVARGQQLPAAERDHGPAGDAQSVDRNAEEVEHVGAGPQRAEHDQERVEADASGDLLRVRGREVLGEAVEDQRAADRVDDREQRREGEQEGDIRRRREAAPIRADDLFHSPAVQYGQAPEIETVADAKPQACARTLSIFGHGLNSTRPP